MIINIFKYITKLSIWATYHNLKYLDINDNAYYIKELAACLPNMFSQFLTLTEIFLRNLLFNLLYLTKLDIFLHQLVLKIKNKVVKVSIFINDVT